MLDFSKYEYQFYLGNVFIKLTKTQTLNETFIFIYTFLKRGYSFLIG